MTIGPRTGLLAVCAAAALAHAQRFTIVALPDTQFYSEHPEWAYHFNAQTQWCVDHASEWDIAFVTQLGDVVQHGSQLPEWQRADAAIGRLDGRLPYSVAIGNHDWGSTGNKDAPTDYYRSFFGPQRYAGRPWYGGADPTGLNHFQVFQAGGYAFLHLALEWRPDWKSDAMAWAQSIIDAHPGMPTIVSTHEYATDADGGHRSASGENQFNRLVRANDQVFMVLNGHFTQGNAYGEYHEVVLNDFGRPVYQMLSDYQSRVEGGDGWMRLIEFQPEMGRIDVYTFSPSREERGMAAWENDADSRFGFELDLGQRFSPVKDTIPARTVTFRQGESGYAGSLDTTLRQSQPGTRFYSDDSLWIDGDDPNGSTLDTQSLLRFDGVFGPLGVPADSDILGAVLELGVNNGGSGIGLHRALTTWSNLSTWDSLGAGVQPDGADAASRWSRQLSGVTDGQLSVDVTSDLRLRFNGAADTGWVMLPLGDDGVGVASAEAASLAARPRLVLRIADAPVHTAAFQQGVNGYDGTSDTELRAINPDTGLGQEPRASVDAQYSFLKTNALLRFDGLFGPGAIPAGARITSAVLQVQIVDAGSGLTLHAMRRPWQESDTWNSLLGGVRADDLEADYRPIASAGRDSDAPNLAAGPLGFDVTADVIRWRAGAPNQGWAMLPWPSGIDGVDVATSEWPEVSERPRLIVRYLAGCAADFDGDGAADTRDVLAFLNVWAASDPSADMNGDGIIDSRDVLAFLNIWAAGC
ncbi:MAG: DNRLRE domain-containing protein [Phycisphaerales bacterium]|nr:DNRLRE domain-containing protein [Phycisphaerales bacterium]